MSDAATKAFDDWAASVGYPWRAIIPVTIAFDARGLPEAPMTHTDGYLARAKPSVPVAKPLPEVEELREDRDALLDALRMVQWNRFVLGLKKCPNCGFDFADGHHPECCVGRALARPR